MDFSQNNISPNNGNNFGMQTNFLNKKPAGLNFSAKINKNETYYAKKGEPMYLKDMDKDEDGIISLDEFRDYCHEKGYSSKKMTQMLETAVAYRTMQKQNKASKEISKNDKDEQIKQKERVNEAVYAKRGDGNYDEIMDTNNDDKVTYKEYIEYCREHSRKQERKADTKIEETEDGAFKTISSGKVVNTYSDNELEFTDGMVDNIG